MQKPNKRLINQTAIVTGANSGIGLAIAQGLGRDGANVVVNYVSNPDIAAGIVKADHVCKFFRTFGIGNIIDNHIGSITA